MLKFSYELNARYPAIDTRLNIRLKITIMDENMQEDRPQKNSARRQGLKPEDLKYINGKQLLKGGVCGLYIGIAVIVPGVSGSTISIVTKLYEKILFALSNLFKSFKYCFLFLLPILTGIAIGAMLGLIGIHYLLNLMFFAVVAFFAGLMTGSYPAVYEEIKNEKVTPVRIILFVTGILVPIAISATAVFAAKGNILVLEDPDIWQYFAYLALGYIAAITQLVPGLSATSLLMTAGVYSLLVDSADVSYWGSNPGVFIIYACLIIGFVIGLLTFSKLLTTILTKNRAVMFFTAAGLSLGSIIGMFFNPDIYKIYLSWASGESYFLDLVIGFVLFAAGFALTFLLIRAQKKRAKKKTKMPEPENG